MTRGKVTQSLNMTKLIPLAIEKNLQVLKSGCLVWQQINHIVQTPE
jgi:hypothetical protein